MTRILAKATGVQMHRVQAFAISERIPPETMQLWDVGPNGTDYGTHIWNERSVDAVMTRYNERGNRLLVDVEHNGAAMPDGEPSTTGGYASLEIRDGAPWLNFEWSAYGAAQIASGERRFLSPEYDVDPNTNEIIRLYRVSLVADPGTYRARVLASAANNQESTMDPTLSAIMAILNTVEDPTAAVAAVKDLVANMADADAVDDTVTDPVDPPADPQPAFAAADTSKADDSKAVQAAAEKPADPKPVAATSPAAPVAPVVDIESIRATREIAKQSENVLRDILLAQGGHRLQPSIRTWASSQSLAVVRGLIAAAPEASPAAPVKVSATRGAGHGTGEPLVGLKGGELEELQKSMGTFRASAPKEIHKNGRGEWVFPTIPPSEYRAIKAAAAAKAGK